MRAVLCRELGPPSSLVIEEVADPVAAQGQVVVDIAAAGVNYVDALFVAGRYQIKPALPFIPGSEIAGVVASTGPGVHDWAPGDRVLASSGIGGFATKVALAAGALYALPAGLDDPRAATFTQSYCTALFALRDRGGLGPGETLLVLGAGGGVGLAAIDVAVSMGATVLAAASTPAKRAAATAAGAAATIDSTAEPLKERARALAGGTGVDMVFDPVGGALAEPALRALGDRGRYLVIGFASGDIPALPLNQVLLRNRSVIGVDWGAWAMSHGSDQGQLLNELLARVAEGRLHPVAPTTYPLEEVAAALDALTGRAVVGKVALVP
jgi:NADPH2:quinone reductase